METLKSAFDPRQTLRLTLARCALVRTMGRDPLTTLEVGPPSFRPWQIRVSESEAFPKGKHDDINDSSRRRIFLSERLFDPE